jgi:hypothetical protein
MGAVPLNVLESEMRQWIKDQQAKDAAAATPTS